MKRARGAALGFVSSLASGLVVVGSAAVAAPGDTTRVSVSSTGKPGNAPSGLYPSRAMISISADGRLVAFVSRASNLVEGDTNDAVDIFVHDTITSETERVSVNTAGEQADGDSAHVAISADGRVVAFSSVATNLVPNDTNNYDDIFVHDRTTGITERASVNTAGEQVRYYSCWDSGAVRAGCSVSISENGRFIAFNSVAPYLVSDDTDYIEDVFVRDRVTGTTTRVSVSTTGVAGNGASELPSISADGRYVAFRSGATNLVVGDTNGFRDVFVHDRMTRVTERTSVSSANEQANGRSGAPVVSATGRYVVFSAYASNLIPDDLNADELLVRDRQFGATERINHPSQLFSGYPAISSDGRYVSFDVQTQCNSGHRGVIVHDRRDGTYECASVNSSGEVASDDTGGSTMSADGRFVAFWSIAANLAPGEPVGDVFVHERAIGKSLHERAAELAISLTDAGTPYTWGAKGWDYASDSYVNRSVLDSGYTYCGYDKVLGKCSFPAGRGTDCSGLVMWSYNKAFGATDYKPVTNPIAYENADGQCVHNADAIEPSTRRAGDLMCFDLDAAAAGFDHIAMYVGGDDVANASSPAVGIVKSSASVLEGLSGFRGYFRPSNAKVDFEVRAYSPVDLVVSDPEGFTIDAQTAIKSEWESRREVFRQLYYTEVDVNRDGDVDDVVYAPTLKLGNYVIKPVRRAGRAAERHVFPASTC